MKTFTDLDAVRIVDDATDRILELEAALRRIAEASFIDGTIHEAIRGARDVLDKKSSVRHDPVTATATGAV